LNCYTSYKRAGAHVRTRPIIRGQVGSERLLSETRTGVELVTGTRSANTNLSVSPSHCDR